MSTTFRHPTRKTFYRRVYIPQKIRQHFKGRVEVWRSLKTADAEEADLRASEFEARTKRLFVTLKREGDRMTQAQIDRLVSQWLDSELDEAEDYRALSGPVSDQAREDQLMGLSIMQDESYEALVSCDYRTIAAEADELLKSAGLPPLDHDGVEFGRLCRRLLIAKQEYVTIEEERWNGVYRDRGALTNQSVANNTPPSAPRSSSDRQGAVQGPLFSEVVKKYMAEHRHVPRTAKPLEAELQKFITAIGGDRSISAITKTEGRTYKEHLLNERKLGLQTVSKHLSSLAGLFRWAIGQGYVTEGSNPFTGLAPNKKVVRKEMLKRRPYTDEELLKIFGSKEFIKQRERNPSRYWVCLLLLFQICRREEAAQLALADLQEEDGIPFVRINDDPKLEQNLKNEGSKRRVPIHSSLLQLGFMAYVEGIRQGGHVRLFPDLKKGHNGFSDPVGKWWSRLATKCDVIDPGVVLHSLRHGGITKLHAAGVSREVVEVLAGHAADNVHGRVYVHREKLPLSLLREGLEKLRYEEVVKRFLN